eukprot:750856-Prorocentrum_minimum.AAC.1
MKDSRAKRSPPGLPPLASTQTSPRLPAIVQQWAHPCERLDQLQHRAAVQEVHLGVRERCVRGAEGGRSAGPVSDGAKGGERMAQEDP